MIPFETGFWDPPWEVIKFVAKAIGVLICIAALIFGVWAVLKILGVIFRFILAISPLWLGFLAIYLGYNLNWWWFWILFPIACLIGYFTIDQAIKDDGESILNFILKGFDD
jgi:protein-S-isoprenylcysteine O-methyltransferase Ste14